METIDLTQLSPLAIIYEHPENFNENITLGFESEDERSEKTWISESNEMCSIWSIEREIITHHASFRYFIQEKGHLNVTYVNRKIADRINVRFIFIELHVT